MVFQTFLCCFNIYEGSWVCGICSLVKKDIFVYRLFPGDGIVEDSVNYNVLILFLPDAVYRVGEGLSSVVQLRISSSDDSGGEKTAEDQL